MSPRRQSPSPLVALALLSAVLLPAADARAGRGSSNAALRAAVASGSPDAIVSEVERAEKLACLACIDTVMPLLDHADARVRDVAAWWLGKRAVRGLVRDAAYARLLGRDATLARNGAEALGRLGRAEAVPALAEHLARPVDEGSAVAAARALGRIGHRSARPALRETATSGASPRLRAAALAALREVGGARAADDADSATLLGALADPDAQVRTQAIYSVGALRDPAAIATLMSTVVTDPAPAVRKHAAWALGQLGDARAASALEQARRDPDAQVRSMARVAMGRLR